MFKVVNIIILLVMFRLLRNPLFGFCAPDFNTNVICYRNRVGKIDDFWLPNCDEIENNIYLGNAKAAVNYDIITRLNITHILTIDSHPIDKTILKCYNITNLYIKAYDNERQNIIQYFELTNDFIKNGERNGAILIHCQVGVSRSATLMIAYLMDKYKIGFRDAYHMVKQSRPEINPNRGFIHQLKLYEELVFEDDISFNARMRKLKMKAVKFKYENIIQFGEGLRNVCTKCFAFKAIIVSLGLLLIFKLH